MKGKGERWQRVKWEKGWKGGVEVGLGAEISNAKVWKKNTWKLNFYKLHIDELNCSSLTQKTMLFPKVIGCQIRSPVPDVALFSIQVISQGCPRALSPKQFRILPLLLVAYQNLTVSPYYWIQCIVLSQDLEKASWCWSGIFCSAGESL